MGIIYEIERKFLFSFHHLPKFHKNQGGPPFKSLVFQGCKAYRDTYYDTPDLKLNGSNTWLRRRNETWEAKSLKNGSQQKATYQEFEGGREISKMLLELGFPVGDRRRRLDVGKLGFSPIMEFATARRVYKVDGKFTVVLDTTDFGHSVGEVEVMSTDPEGTHMEIDHFMDKYKWFFVQSKAIKSKGKCNAYWKLFPR